MRKHPKHSKKGIFLVSVQCCVERGGGAKAPALGVIDARPALELLHARQKMRGRSTPLRRAPRSRCIRRVHLRTARRKVALDELDQRADDVRGAQPSPSTTTSKTVAEPSYWVLARPRVEDAIVREFERGQEQRSVEAAIPTNGGSARDR